MVKCSLDPSGEGHSVFLVVETREACLQREIRNKESSDFLPHAYPARNFAVLIPLTH
jgi:hypothetical protein